MTQITTPEGPPYVVQNRPLGAVAPNKHTRIVGIGAGASGINMIRTLRKNMNMSNNKTDSDSSSSYSHVVYEKNPRVGGTWFEHRYPNCRCDIPSHNYQFSWRPNKRWSNFFSPAEEIERYLEDACRSEGLDRDIKTRHQVLGCRWDSGRGMWDVRVKDLETGEEFVDEANFVIDAAGVLNNWKWPDVPGLGNFQGDLIHTARWPENFDVTDKTVVVIGNGATGVQLLPALQPKAKNLHHIIRTPTWVLPPRVMMMAMQEGSPAKEMMKQIELDEAENFTAQQIERFESDPDLYRKFVKVMEMDSLGTFPVVTNPAVRSYAQSKVEGYMRLSLGNRPDLCEKLIPKYPLGMRRMTPAPNYLSALASENVEVRSGVGIAEVLPEGLRLSDGEVVDGVDAIICATGFDNSFVPRFPVVVGGEGEGEGENLQDRFRRETPRGYMSVAYPGVPNYFTFFGPNGPIGHGSCFTLAEHVARYITRAILKCQREGIRSLTPSYEAVAEYSEHIDSFMPLTAWGFRGSEAARSWFKNGKEDGPVIALHPGSRLHFFETLQGFRGEDWDYEYDCEFVDDDDDDAGEEEGEKKRQKKKQKKIGRRNRFAYLGNGFSRLELEAAAGTLREDPTWYLDEGAAERL